MWLRPPALHLGYELCTFDACEPRTPSKELIMEILGMILLGLIAGALAKLLMPGRDGGGFILTIVLGIAGSLLGGVVFNAMGLGDGSRWAGLIGSVIGAIVILAVYRMIAGRRRIA